jgi:diguanylate cyclase
VIVAPGVSLDSAATIAERLRDRIEHLRVKVRGTEQVLDNITASFGVSTYRSGDSLESLFERADKAMYAAKAAGRNTVQTEACTVSKEQATRGA